MSELRLPSHWSGMSFQAKAGYLVQTRQASSYSEACSKLARRRLKLAPAAKPAVQNLWWNQ